jgi:hypothetical protein
MRAVGYINNKHISWAEPCDEKRLQKHPAIYYIVGIKERNFTNERIAYRFAGI